MHPKAILLTTALALLNPLAHAKPLGFDWVTIGDPGNRAATVAEAGDINAGYGSVGYTYRMTRTEVTVDQHFAFIEVARPFYNFGTLTQDDVWFGHAIGIRPGTADPYAAPGWGNSASSMSVITAARYCNWLHNGMVAEAWAFESGAYDIASLGQIGPDGNANQILRSDGARYWIPNLNEWMKGMYWDPNKDGVGGYWTYPHASDEQPVPGAPGEPGAQTSAGNIPLNMFGQSTGPVDVGSYPDAASPFGLLDGSGGAREWLETRPESFGTRLNAGTAGSGRQPDNDYWLWDNIFLVGGNRNPTSLNTGFRIASLPNPGTTFVMGGFIWHHSLRRRSKCS